LDVNEFAIPFDQRPNRDCGAARVMEMKLCDFRQRFCGLCSGSFEVMCEVPFLPSATCCSREDQKIKGPRLGNDSSSERRAAAQGIVSFTPASPLRLFVTRQVMAVPS
jgi:hypothetical protein